jgi:hypothetical protein
MPITLVKILAIVPPLPIVCNSVPAPHDVITAPVSATKHSDERVIFIFFIILFN